MAEQAAKNTDREIWREFPDDYYSPSIHVTQFGVIGINVGGLVYVRKIDVWHGMVATIDARDKRIAELEAAIEVTLEYLAMLEYLDDTSAISSEGISKLRYLLAPMEGSRSDRNRIAELTEQNRKLREMLKGEIEYQGVCSVCCQSLGDGHASDCKFAALLGEEKT